MKQLVAVAIILFLGQQIFSQELTQTIRGKVIDSELKTTLPGANIILLNSDPVIGTVTDAEGRFEINEVPIGRQSLKVTFLGYDDKVIPEIMVGSAKEVVLTVPLVEKLITLKAVEVKSKKAQGKALNQMATVSARSFSVEETKRYAASISDPARMALAFAGVSNTEDLSNEIVIRGNSPNGLLWRMEGVEIPGPNHFAEEGYSTGYVSMLSANLVGSSDFFTGAFPAEYGNALSGVFDITLREGNNRKREYSFQVGILGTDVAMEGPWKPDYDGSYLINYRYSTLKLLEHIGLNIIGDQSPSFQDLSWKLTFPTNKIGKFSLWGITGNTRSDDPAEQDSTLWDSDWDRKSNRFLTGMVATGLTHMIYPDKKSYLRTVLSYSESTSSDKTLRLNDALVNELDYEDKAYSAAYRASLMYHRKINNKLILRSGINYSYLDFDFKAEGINDDTDIWEVYIKDKGNTSLTQFYSQLKYRHTEKVSLVAGLHSMHFALNQNQTFEPRFGLNWNIRKNKTISVGIGKHSRIEQLSTYFLRLQQPDDSYYQPNKNLAISNAMHYVVSYDHYFNKNLHAKVEAYYQFIKDVPIVDDPTRNISMINSEYTMDTLVNKGKGQNLGVEITVEKFFSDNYYFMVTTSIFDSKYKCLDGKWYDSRYDMGYVSNFIGGKEWKVGKSKKNILGVNGKFLLNGGQRDIPVLFDESRAQGETILEQQDRWGDKVEEYYRLDVGISYRVNNPKVAHIISFDIQNVTNHLNVWGTYYDDEEDKIMTFYQTGIIPILNYRLEF